jgi:hypothetical protein
VADSYVRIPSDSTGKYIRTWQTSVAGTDVQEHYMIPVDENGVRQVFGAGGEAQVVFDNAVSGVVSVSGTVTATQTAGWTMSVNNEVSGVVSVSGPVCANVANAISGVVSVSGVVYGDMSGVVSVSGPVCANVANAISGVVGVSGNVTVLFGASAMSGVVGVSGTVVATQTAGWTMSVNNALSGVVGVSGSVSGVMGISGTVGVTGCVSAVQGGAWTATVAGNLTNIATITTVQSATVYQGTNPWTIDGAISATNPSVATSFSAAPSQVAYIGGYDGTNVVPIKVDASGVVAFTATVNAVNSSVVTAFSAAPDKVGYVGGFDGTNIVPIKVNASGVVFVDTDFTGSATSAVPGMVGFMGGTDGTNLRGFAVRTTGDPRFVATTASAVPAIACFTGGTDGTNVRAFTLRTTGDPRYVATANSAVPAIVDFVGGTDGTNIRALAVRTTGDARNVATVTSAVPLIAAYFGGTDGTNINGVRVDASGTVQMGGNVANDAADSGNPVKIGGVAMVTTFPVSAAQGDRVNFAADKYGAQITRLEAARDQIVNFHAGAVTTAETVILTAVASCYVDLYAVTFSNLTTSEHTVTVKDGSAGTTKFIIPLRSMSVDGIAFTRPWPQSGISCNWTAQLAATGTVAVSAYGVKYV